jgi:glyoxylase-like metal-dependent hydrolase (beta-lactamase superfamily II)
MSTTPALHLITARDELLDVDVRGALLLGPQVALVWDTLIRPGDMAGLAPLIGGRRLLVVYSHADWDHCWGTAGLRAFDPLVLGCVKTLRRFAGDVPATLAQFRAEAPGRWDDIELIPPAVVCDGFFSVDLGYGCVVEFYPLPGHTEDCLVAWVPSLGLLLGGDTVETPLPVIEEESPVAEWLAALERWAAEPLLRDVIPSHGTPGGRTALEGTIAYLRGWLAGLPPSPEEPLDDFYRTTHATNVRYAAAHHTRTKLSPS